MSDVYICGLHAMLHNCLNRAVKDWWILRNPSDDCIVPKQQKWETRILQANQVSAYLRMADEQGVLPLFFLEPVISLRKSELVALFWSDLDLENQALSVSKRNRQSQIARPKTKISIRQISTLQETINLLLQEHEKHLDNPYVRIAQDRRDVPSRFSGQSP